MFRLNGNIWRAASLPQPLKPAFWLQALPKDGRDLIKIIYSRIPDLKYPVHWAILKKRVRIPFSPW